MPVDAVLSANGAVWLADAGGGRVPVELGGVPVELGGVPVELGGVPVELGGVALETGRLAQRLQGLEGVASARPAERE